MKKDIALLGFYSALAAFVAAVGYCVVQILQITGLIIYPVDDILIYGFSLGIAPPFLLAMLALHYSVPGERRIWSHAALLFAILYNAYVILMYTVQLTVVIPASIPDASKDVLVAAPHSFFWTIDALGYICLGISTLFAAFVFVNKGPEKWIRRFFIANGLMVPVIMFVYFYPHFSVGLLLIAFPWVITVPGSLLLLSIFFKRNVPKN